MSKITRIPNDKLHEIVLLAIQKKDYQETDIVELAKQISEDYLKAYNSLQKPPSDWKGVTS